MGPPRLVNLWSLAFACLILACAPVEEGVELPEHSFGPNIDSVAYEGVLAFDQPCLFLTRGGDALNMLWPAGYRLVGNPPAVVRDDGVVMARVGDSVTIGGAPADVVGGAQEGLEIAPPGCPPRLGLLVGLIDSVNGARVPPWSTSPPESRPVTTERPRPR